MWQTITSTSVLMRLSRLAGTGNFGSSSLSPFLSIVLILPSQAVSFQIFLYAFFPDFPWSTLLTFPCYFKIHNLTYLWISTHYMTIPLQTALSYPRSSQQHPPCPEEHQSRPYQPVSPNTSSLSYKAVPPHATSLHPQQ